MGQVRKAGSRKYVRVSRIKKGGEWSVGTGSTKVSSMDLQLVLIETAGSHPDKTASAQSGTLARFSVLSATKTAYQP